MDLALNDLQRLICRKAQSINNFPRRPVLMNKPTAPLQWGKKTHRAYWL